MKRDKWEYPQIKTSLVRCKSTGSLQSSSGSIEALRARFESKVDTQNMARGVKNSPASIKAAEIPQVTDREGEGKSLKEKPRSQTADAPQEGKDAPSSKKVNQDQRHVKIAKIFQRFIKRLCRIYRNEVHLFTDDQIIQSCLWLKAADECISYRWRPGLEERWGRQ